MFKIIWGSIGAPVSIWPVTRKQRVIEQNGLLLVALLNFVNIFTNKIVPIGGVEGVNLCMIFTCAKGNNILK